MARQSLFFAPKDKELSGIVSLRSPGQARKSAHKLYALARKAKKRARMTKIQRAALLARARAKAFQKRRNLSGKERKQFAKIQTTYGYVAARIRKLRERRSQE